MRKPDPPFFLLIALTIGPRTVMDLGQSIGPFRTGWVVGMSGYSPAFTLRACLLALATVPLGVFGRTS